MTARKTTPAPDRPIHGFDGEWANGLNKRSSTFSYGVFAMVLTKDGKAWKNGKMAVRICGSSSVAVMHETQRVCDALDAGTYTGPKRVWVGPRK